MTTDTDIAVVLPTYREAENLRTLVPAILEAGPNRVIVVDDGSRDGTAEILDRLDPDGRRVRLLDRGEKLGLGSAYREGLRRALDTGADIVVTMDADWSHHPRYIPTLAAKSATGVLAIGSRYVPGGGIVNWPLHRRALSRGAGCAARLVLGPIARDLTSGYRAYPRRALETVAPESIRSDGYSFLIEMGTRLHRAGIGFAEVPILFEDRRGGVSKISQKEIFRAVGTLLRLRFHK